jgi:hypothetical protein
LLWQPHALEQLAEQSQQQQHIVEQHQHSGQESDVLRAAQALVLSNSFRLSVPVLEGTLASAARTTLLARALMPPLRAILVQHQLFRSYEVVERPLQRVFAGVRAGGVRLALSSIEVQLQASHQQRTALQHYASKLHGRDDIDISVPAHVCLLLSQLHLGPNRTEQHMQHPLITVLQNAVRNALKQNRHYLLPLLRCLLTYHMVGAKHEHLVALKQSATGLAVDSKEGLLCSDMSTVNTHNVFLQPLPCCSALCGGVASGLPRGIVSIMQQQVAPCLPVVASEGSMADFGVTTLASPTPVVALVPSSEPLEQNEQPQQFGQVLAMLCSVAKAAPVNLVSSPLPLHDPTGNDPCMHSGCVRYWCNLAHTIQHAQLSMSLLHTVETQLPGACLGSEAVTFLPGPISILATIQPSNEACTFVGLDLQQLPLVMLAALSRDPCLLAALSASDPLASAAAHWVNCNGLHANTQHMLGSRIVGGAVDGTPVLPSSVHRALFSLALEAFVLGQKPSVQRALLGLEQSVDLACTLMVAFPALATWRADMLEECRRTG